MSDEKNSQPPAGEVESLPLGPWLKEQRQKKKVSLEEIAAVTKIHIVQLKHLEEGKMSQLPAAAFVRGFLVSYAKHLGLDENDVIARYKKATGVDPAALKETIAPAGLKGARSLTQPKVRMVTTPTFNTNSAASAHGFQKSQMPPVNMRSVVMSAVVVGIISLVIVLVFVGRKSKSKDAPVEIPVAAAPVADAEKLAALTPATPAATPSKSIGPAPAPAPVAPTVTQSPAALAKANAAAIAAKKHQLQVRAVESSWVNVRADDDNSQGFLLKPGSITDFGAERRMVISMSDAGAVELRWDGVWYGAPGYRGDVKALSLPEDLGLLVPKASLAPRARPKPAAPAAPATPPVDVAPSTPVRNDSAD